MEWSVGRSLESLPDAPSGPQLPSEPQQSRSAPAAVFLEELLTKQEGFVGSVVRGRMEDEPSILVSSLLLRSRAGVIYIHVVSLTS